jgi:hypothetical protein
MSDVGSEVSPNLVLTSRRNYAKYLGKIPIRWAYFIQGMIIWYFKVQLELVRVNSLSAAIRPSPSSMGMEAAFFFLFEAGILSSLPQ